MSTSAPRENISITIASDLLEVVDLLAAELRLSRSQWIETAVIRNTGAHLADMRPAVLVSMIDSIGSDFQGRKT